MRRKTCTARCHRSGDWWAISAPELRGVHTQARRLEKAEAMTHDAIPPFLDVPADSFDLRVEPVLPRIFRRKWGESARLGTKPSFYSVKRHRQRRGCRQFGS